MENLHKNIQVMLEFLKSPFLARIYSQKFFASLGIARESIEKLGLDPFLGPTMVQTLNKYFFEMNQMWPFF